MLHNNHPDGPAVILEMHNTSPIYMGRMRVIPSIGHKIRVKTTTILIENIVWEFNTASNEFEVILIPY